MSSERSERSYEMGMEAPLLLRVGAVVGFVRTCAWAPFGGRARDFASFDLRMREEARAWLCRALTDRFVIVPFLLPVLVPVPVPRTGPVHEAEAFFFGVDARAWRRRGWREADAEEFSGAASTSFDKGPSLSLSWSLGQDCFDDPCLSIACGPATKFGVTASN